MGKVLTHALLRVVWSRPIPLAWYFRPQWERIYGTGWTTAMCDRWIENDRNLRNFAYEVCCGGIRLAFECV